MSITRSSFGDVAGIETVLQRLTRKALVMGGLLANPAMLRYKAWLRWRRLDFSAESVASLGLDRATAHEHGMSGGPNLERVLRELKIPPSSCCLDYGSGKGIACLTLAKHFREVLGIELSERLVLTAMNNVWQFKGLAKRVKFAQSDAGDYRIPDDFSWAYIFNSFPGEVVTKVAEQIRASLERTPRPFTVIYKNPACGDALLEAGFKLTRTFTFKNDHQVKVFVV